MDKIVENKKLSSMLSDPSLLKDKHILLVNGLASKNGDTFEVRNPANLEVICKVPDLGLEETRQGNRFCIRCPKIMVFKTGKERSSILKTFYELMMVNAEDLAKIITLQKWVSH